MRAVLVALLLALGGCGAEPEAPAARDILERALAAAPADARLAGLYESSCRACHTQSDSGAPLTHDRAAWDRRWSKGEEILVQHTINGFNGMPPGGQCFSCSAEDYRALIAFMAGREE